MASIQTSIFHFIIVMSCDVSLYIISLQSPVLALLPGKPMSSYDPAADEGEGLLASLGHSLARVVQGVGLDEEEDELSLELTVSTSIEIT